MSQALRDWRAVVFFAAVFLAGVFAVAFLAAAFFRGFVSSPRAAFALATDSFSAAIRSST